MDWMAASTSSPVALVEESGARLRAKPLLGPAHETTSIMGLPFHRLDHLDLVRQFLEGVRTGKGGWIVTPNLDILRQFTGSS